MSLQDDFDEALRENFGAKAKRRGLEERVTFLHNAIRDAGKQSAAVSVTGAYVARQTITGLLDIARIAQTTANPGDFICGPSVNATKFNGHRVIFVTDSVIQQLLTDGAIAPAN